MHGWNLCNMRCVLAVGRGLWTEHSDMARDKTTAPANRERMVWLASGGGEGFLLKEWRSITSNAHELARLGLQVTPDARPTYVGPLPTLHGMELGVPSEDIPKRLMSLLLHTSLA
jgi:hypothetical protein